MRVVMFTARHEPVTGQRKTPETPSAHNTRRPGVISTLFGPHPLVGLIVTTRDVASGFRDVESQQSRGAGFVEVHTTVVPAQVPPEAMRDTIPLASTHTVTGVITGWAAMLGVGATPTKADMIRAALAARATRLDHRLLMRFPQLSLRTTLDPKRP